MVFNDEFVLRYEPDNVSDGLPPGEGAFLACSFWLVDNYILQGRYEDAQRLLNGCSPAAMMWGCSRKNSIRRAGALLGNFPRPTSHVGLINCALNLTHRTGPAERAASRST